MLCYKERKHKNEKVVERDIGNASINNTTKDYCVTSYENVRADNNNATLA